MRLKHTATVTIPYEATVDDLAGALAALADLPNKAKVRTSVSKRDYDQRDNSSWGGETTFTVSWES